MVARIKVALPSALLLGAVGALSGAAIAWTAGQPDRALLSALIMGPGIAASILFWVLYRAERGGP